MLVGCRLYYKKIPLKKSSGLLVLLKKWKICPFGRNCFNVSFNLISDSRKLLSCMARWNKTRQGQLTERQKEHLKQVYISLNVAKENKNFKLIACWHFNRGFVVVLPIVVYKKLKCGAGQFTLAELIAFEVSRIKQCP